MKPVPAPASPRANPGDEAPAGTAQTAEAPCPLCAGTGRVDNNGAAVVCPECAGSGRIVATVGDA